MKFRYVIFLISLLACCFLVASPAIADPTDAAGWYNEGQLLTNSGNYTDAVYAYKQALNLDPQSADIWDGLADCLNRASWYTQTPLSTLAMALDASNQSLSLNKSSASAWVNHGLILYNIGSYYQRNLDDKATATIYYNEQLDAFNTAISVDPNSAEAWFNKGYALCGLGRCTEGIAAFEKVQELDPNYPNLAANIAIAQKVAATEEPFYIKYDVEIGMLIIAGIVATVWYFAVKKKY